MDRLVQNFINNFTTVRGTIGTVLSLIGMGLTVMSFQMKAKKKLLFFQITGSTFFFISYLFLKGIFGSTMNGALLIRNFIFLGIDTKTERKKTTVALILLSIGYLVTYVIYTAIDRSSPATAMLNLCAMFAAFFGTMALTRSEPVSLRLWKIPDSVLWLIYNVAFVSPGGILCEIFNLTSNIISMIRFRNRKPKVSAHMSDPSTSENESPATISGEHDNTAPED